MGAMASQITGVSMVWSTVFSGADYRKPQSSTWLAFVRGIYQWPVDSSHKGPVTRECFYLMTSSWTKNKLFGLWRKVYIIDIFIRIEWSMFERNGSYPLSNIYVFYHSETIKLYAIYKRCDHLDIIKPIIGVKIGGSSNKYPGYTHTFSFLFFLQ